MPMPATTSSAHTPGPWRVSAVSPTRVFNKESHPDDDTAIAICDDADVPLDEQEANARLIAVAPDYHEAAIEAVEDWQDLGHVSAEAIAKLQNAIAKANGKCRCSQ